MNRCGYCGNQNDADAPHCPSCGTDLAAPTPETLAVLVSRLSYRQMFLAPVWALLASLFLPSGLALLLGDSTGFPEFWRPNYRLYQAIAAFMFLSLGTLSIIVGYRVHRKLSRPPGAPSRRRTLIFLLSGLLL